MSTAEPDNYILIKNIVQCMIFVQNEHYNLPYLAKEIKFFDLINLYC